MDDSAGSFGTGCFSLYATKNMTAGEGGIVTTDDPALAAHLRRLRSHGEDERYESVELGYNYRLPETSAAIALAQLPRLQELTAATPAQRRTSLSAALKGVGLPDAAAGVRRSTSGTSTRYASDQGRDALRAHLREKGIETAVYYPKTLPAQKLYRDLGYDEAAFPVARRLADEVLSLPVHPGLSDSDLEQIVAAVNAMDGVVSDDLAVGVVGLGFGANHARVLSELPGVRLAAVCDKDEPRLEDVHARGREAAPYSDFAAMLREREARRRGRRGAGEAARPVRHGSPSRPGCAVLVEKPLATSYAEGVDAGRRPRPHAGVPLMAGHIERFNPARARAARDGCRRARSGRFCTWRRDARRRCASARRTST